MLWELIGDDVSEQGLPPGFRFHPTDEELVTFYLASKVFNGGFCGVDIVEVDLNRCEPWELPGMAYPNQNSIDLMCIYLLVACQHAFTLSSEDTVKCHSECMSIKYWDIKEERDRLCLLSMSITSIIMTE